MSLNTGNNPAPVPSNLITPGLSLAQLIAILWAYRFWIVGATLSMAIVSVVLSKLVLPKTYESTATLLIDFAVNDPITGRDLPTGLASSYMATQIEAIQGPNTLHPALDRLGWLNDPERSDGFDGGGEVSLTSWLSRNLSENLTVKQGADSRFIYITYTAHSPGEAAHVANTIADTFVEEQHARSTKPAQQLTRRYREQLDDLRAAVNDAQSQVTRYREQSGLLNLEQDGVADRDRLLDIERRLSEAESRRREAQQRLQYATESDARVLGSGLIQSLKTRVAELEASVADLSTSLGPRHPRYVAQENELAAARMRLGREIDAYLGNARAELAAAQTQERSLRAQRNNARTQMQSDRSLQDEGARYLRELESAKRAYQQALDEYDRLQLGTRNDQSSANVASRATPPLNPSSPKTVVNLILALILGGGLAVTACFVIELLNRRVRCRDDVERDLDLPVLAELNPAGARRRLIF
ncbi:Wzz/FepE/Etk N-terminal domain-containing protein [Abyssibacter sp.]|jgi:uncharacterized protein involved in exopolysaccharide biosynthesis|uniref:Wzz/FepE/Etk N-terminal domain-containing protein n=1 Tax=Abyssibacter sp. TaxID=2320200 RepID=UPI003517DF0C